MKFKTLFQSLGILCFFLFFSTVVRAQVAEWNPQVATPQTSGVYNNLTDNSWYVAANWNFTSGSAPGGIPDANTDVIIPGGVPACYIPDEFVVGSVNTLPRAKSITIQSGGALNNLAGKGLGQNELYLEIANNLTINAGGTYLGSTEETRVNGDFLNNGDFIIKLGTNVLEVGKDFTNNNRISKEGAITNRKFNLDFKQGTNSIYTNNNGFGNTYTTYTAFNTSPGTNAFTNQNLFVTDAVDEMLITKTGSATVTNNDTSDPTPIYVGIVDANGELEVAGTGNLTIISGSLLIKDVVSSTTAITVADGTTTHPRGYSWAIPDPDINVRGTITISDAGPLGSGNGASLDLFDTGGTAHNLSLHLGGSLFDENTEEPRNDADRRGFYVGVTTILTNTNGTDNQRPWLVFNGVIGGTVNTQTIRGRSTLRNDAADELTEGSGMLLPYVIILDNDNVAGAADGINTQVELASAVRIVGDITIHKNTRFNLLSNKVLLGDNPDDELNTFGILTAQSNAEFRMHDDVIIRGRSGGSYIMAGSISGPVFHSRGDTGNYRIAMYSGSYVSVFYGDYFGMNSDNDDTKGAITSTGTSYNLSGTGVATDDDSGGNESGGGFKVYPGAILDPTNNFSFTRIAGRLTLNMTIPTLASNPTYGTAEWNSTGFGSITIDGFFFGGGTSNSIVRNNSQGAIIVTNALGNSAAGGVGETYDRGDFKDTGDPDRIIWNTFTKCIWKGGASSGSTTSWNNPLNWINESGGALGFVPGTTGNTGVDVIIPKGADNDCELDVNNIELEGTLRVNFPDGSYTGITGSANRALSILSGVTLFKVGGDFMSDNNGDITIHSDALPNQCRIEVGGTINIANSATLTAGTSTIACVGDQRQRISLRGEELYTLEVAVGKTGDVYSGGDVTMNGNLEVYGGSYIGNANASDITIKGDFLQTGGDIYPWNSDFFMRGNWLNSGGTMANAGNGTFNFEPGNTTTKQIQTNGQSFTTVNFNDRSLGSVTQYNLVDDWTILTKIVINNDCQLNIPDGLIGNFGRTNINSGGILDIQAGGTLAIEDGERINLRDGGKMKIIGENEKYARLTRQGSTGSYTFNVEGTISARYYLIESMDANGVNLLSGAKTESPGTITYGGGGSGYTSAPTVTVAGGGGSNADFEAVLTGNVVTSYAKRNALSSTNIVSGGTGYPTDGNFSITVAGGSPDGSVVVTVNSGVITAVSISSQGSGYTSTPTLDLSSLGTPTSAATVNLAISDVPAGGSGFTQTPTVVITGGGGSGATGSAQLTGTTLDKIVIFNGGAGYNDGTHAYTVQGGAPNATVDFVVSGGVITAINVTSAGGGYTGTPTIDITAVAGIGTPTTAASVDAYLTATSIDQIIISAQQVYPVATFSDGIFTDGIAGGTFITIADDNFSFYRAANDVYSKNADATPVNGTDRYTSTLPAGVTNDYNTNPRIDTIYNIVFPKNPGGTGQSNIRRAVSNNNPHRKIIIKDALGTFSGDDFDNEDPITTRAAGDPNTTINPNGLSTGDMIEWVSEGVKRWDGGPTSTGTSWSDPLNWRPDGVPGPGDKVIISYDLLQLQWNVVNGPPDVIAPTAFNIDFDLDPASQAITCRSLIIESILPDPNSSKSTKLITLNITRDMTILENVVISSDVDVKPNSGITMKVGGSWNNDGDFNPDASIMTVDFNQSFTRTVTNGGGSRFSNVLFSQGITDLGSDLYVEGNLTISSGATLSPSNNNRKITLQGNWANSGTFDPKQGTVQFGDGNSLTQTVTKTPSNEPQEFYSVIVQKPAGILETGSRMQINRQLDIKNGKIKTAKDKEVIFGDNSNLPLVEPSTYVDGPCGHLYSDATTSANFKFFPIGKDDTYIGGSNANRRIQLSVRTTNVSIPAGQFLLMIMEQFETPAPARTIPTTSIANYVSRSRYWRVTQGLYPNTDSGPLQNGATDVTIETAKIQLAFDASSERGEYTQSANPTNPWLFGTSVQEVDFAELGGLVILKDDGADKKGEGDSYPMVTVTDNTPGSGASATAVVNASGQVTGFTNIVGGSGYSSANPPLITIGGGGDENGILNAQTTANNAGTGATATAIVDGGGVITGFTLTSPGSGYNTDDPPIVTVGGVGAIGRAVVAGNQITSIEVIAQGTGYKSPVVTISGVTFTTPADYNATANAEGRITGFTQVSAGSGYTTGSTEWQDAGSTINNINSQQFTVESTGPNVGDNSFSTLGDGIFTLAWNFIALPVQFLNLDAKAIDNEKVAVQWVTNDEDKVARFEVQASRDGGKTFKTIGQRFGKGNGRGAMSYEFLDDTPVDGTNYYRLRQVDINGLERFTKVISANINRPATFTITPNPVSKGQSVKIALSAIAGGERVVVKLLDIKGNVLSSQEVTGASVLDYQVPSSLATGMYMLKLETAQKSYQAKLIVR